MTTPDLGQLFESFTTSAFRLECLPAYQVPQEAESIAAWRAGKSKPSTPRAWLTTVRAAIDRGARMQRVRLVESPPTEYQERQIAWAYPDNEAAGEELYVLDHRPEGLLSADFWLFDDATAVVMEYDDHGRFLRPVVAETVEPYRHARDMALKSSVPFREYRRSLTV
jgi:hypothetical protein